MMTSILIILTVASIGSCCIWGLWNGLKTVFCSTLAAGLITLIGLFV